MKILMVGDIVGAPGRAAFARAVAELQRTGACDFVVANAENAAGGKGLTASLAKELFAAGANVLTTGDHAWDLKEALNAVGSQPAVLRPANYAPACPGKGFVTVETAAGPVTAINLLGRVFMQPADCPFRAADAVLALGNELGRIILVDFHAEATAEKTAMGFHLDGRVTAVVGTHTHVQTSDERLLPKGTAYITDLGMTGPLDSVIGCSAESVMPHFLTGMKSRFEVKEKPAAATMEGVLIDIDAATGRATGIARIRM